MRDLIKPQFFNSKHYRVYIDNKINKIDTTKLGRHARIFELMNRENIPGLAITPKFSAEKTKTFGGKKPESIFLSNS